MKLNKNRKAFTLVEVMITCIILGILFIVLVANVDFSPNAAREVGVKATLEAYENACRSVGMEQGGLTNDLNSLVALLNKKLDSEMHIKVDNGVLSTGYADPWGQSLKIQYAEPINAIGELTISSAGADGKFGTVDDFISVVRYDALKAEVVVEHPVNDPDHTHVYDQKLATPKFLATVANCQTPMQFYWSCECGKAGNVAFTDGDIDPNNHTVEKQTYKSLNKDQHQIITLCRDCGVEIRAVNENHLLTKDGNQCQYCWIEGGLHEHEYVMAIATDAFKADPATCTEPAYYYMSCSCGDKNLNEKFAVGSGLGHQSVFAGTKNAHTKCARCNIVLETEHPMLSESINSPATCATPGNKQMWCGDANGNNGCGYHEQYISIPVLGHTPSGNASCTEDVTCTTCHALLQRAGEHEAIQASRYNACTECQICGKVLSAEHNLKVDETRSLLPTCQSRGKYVYTCTLCKYEYEDIDDEDLKVDPNNHIGFAIFPTVSTEDLHLVWSCCPNKSYQNIQHTYSEVPGDWNVRVAPTCTEFGTATQQCLGEHNGRRCPYQKEIVLQPLGHTYKTVNALEPTCTTNGYTTHQECLVCAAKDPLTYQEKPALQHDWRTVGTQALCKKCNRCNETSQHPTPTQFPLSAATCTEGSKTQYECNVCNANWTVTGKPLGHDYKNGNTACGGGDCSRCGKVEGNGSHTPSKPVTPMIDVCSICSVCAEVLKSTHDYPTQNSTNINNYPTKNYENVATANCQDKAEVTSHCKYCDYEKTERTGNKKGDVHKTPNSYHLAGESGAHTRYDCCNAIHSSQHTYVKGTTLNAMCNRKETTPYNCNCGWTKYEYGDYAPNNHPADGMIPGSKANVSCCMYYQCCNKVAIELHTSTAESNWTEMVRATCQKTGTKQYVCGNGCGYSLTKDYGPITNDETYHELSGYKVYGQTIDTIKFPNANRSAHLVWNCCGTTAVLDHPTSEYTITYTTWNDTLANQPIKGTATCKCGYIVVEETCTLDSEIIAEATCTHGTYVKLLFKWTRSDLFTLTTGCTNECVTGLKHEVGSPSYTKHDGGNQAGGNAEYPDAHVICTACKRPKNKSHNFVLYSTSFNCSSQKATITYRCSGTSCTYSINVASISVTAPISRERSCTQCELITHHFKFPAKTFVDNTIPGSPVNIVIAAAEFTQECKDKHVSTLASGHTWKNPTVSEAAHKNGSYNITYYVATFCSTCDYRYDFLSAGAYTKEAKNLNIAATCIKKQPQYTQYTLKNITYSVYNTSGTTAATRTDTNFAGTTYKCGCSESSWQCEGDYDPTNHARPTDGPGGTSATSTAHRHCAACNTTITSSHTYNLTTMWFNGSTTTECTYVQRKQTCSCGYIAWGTKYTPSSTYWSSYWSSSKTYNNGLKYTCTAANTLYHKLSIEQGHVCMGHTYGGGKTHTWTTVSKSCSASSNCKLKSTNHKCSTCGYFCEHTSITYRPQNSRYQCTVCSHWSYYQSMD